MCYQYPCVDKIDNSNKRMTNLKEHHPDCIAGLLVYAHTSPKCIISGIRKLFFSATLESPNIKMISHNISGIFHYRRPLHHRHSIARQGFGGVKAEGMLPLVRVVSTNLSCATLFR